MGIYSVDASGGVVVDVHAADELCDEHLQRLRTHFAHFQHSFVIDRLIVLIAFHHFVSDEGETEDLHVTMTGDQHFWCSTHSFKGKLEIHLK